MSIKLVDLRASRRYASDCWKLPVHYLAKVGVEGSNPFARSNLRAAGASVGHPYEDQATQSSQYPAASAPRVRVSAAPISPLGVTRIEFADVPQMRGTILWPRASRFFSTAGGRPGSTQTSSGSH